MARSITDARQVTLRQFLQQITNASTYAGTADSKPANQVELDNLLAAINDELTPLLRLTASSTPNLIVSVGAAVLSNSESSFQRSIPHIGALLPNSFTSGTITFPSASGGAITVSPGNSGTLTVSSGNYIKVMIYMDATGSLNVLPGVQSTTESAASVLAAPKKTLPIGYVTLQNVGGVIQPIAQNKIYQFGTGAGGASSGSGSGLGSDLSSLTFKAEINDEFDDIPSASTSAVDVTTGKTDSNTYSAANGYYRLSYDASKTVTGTGTAMTLSGAPAFTIKAGDILVVAGEARAITSITSQTVVTIESAFSTNPSAASVNVTQAVYTKDINNAAIDGLAISAAFSTSISQVMVDYEDTTAQDDVIFDNNTTPVIGFSASANGTSYSTVAVRPTNLTDSQSIVNLPASGTNLYIRFFANKTSGTGSVNILKYHAYFHRDLSYLDGSLMNQSSGMTNGTGGVNISSISSATGKTRIKKTWSYPVGVNSGTANGALKVYLNGSKIPRYVSATATPNAYYTEIDQSTIELNQDYSGLNYSFEIIQDQAVVDVTDANTSNIATIQESISEGFQGFVATSSIMTTTNVAGTPSAGLFYSSIVNRASMVDFRSDLKARMGIERIQVQNIYQLQNEFGPNGEPVWATPNDTLGQIRLVGSWSTDTSTLDGNRVFSGTNITDYMEITFYGTGLNLLGTRNDSRNIAYRVDGGSETTVNNLWGTSGILTMRGHAVNAVANVISNLSLGVHTVTIRANANNAIQFSGFEILTETTNIRVQPGSSYVNGKKLTLSSQQTLTYNSGFESGTLGTRGGRVLVYQKSDGTIGKAVQPVDASSTILSSALHTNEEVARVYHWREFGAGRTDDFSRLTGTANVAFTLDDGTTTLVGSGVAPTSNERLIFASNGSFITFTFIGTGCDFLRWDTASGGVDTFTLSVDGGAATTFSSTGTGSKFVQKLVSGLPYGTHTIKLTRTSAPTTYDPGIVQFIVYQPKKPTLPSGAIELADYNILADFVANTTAGTDTIATGIMRKHSTREFIFVGSSWIQSFTATDRIGGWTLGDGGVSGSYAELTFFGTGFEWRSLVASTRSSNVTFSANGTTITTANFPTLVTSVYGGATYNATTGVASMNNATTALGGIRISGLPLGRYTIRLTNNQNTNVLVIDSFDVITPIHSAKSNLNYDQQNTLLVGSNAISDNRKTTPVKDSAIVSKVSVQVVGVSSGPTTTSTTYLPVPDMSATIKTSGGRVSISYSMMVNNSSAGSDLLAQIYVNGVAVGSEKIVANGTNYSSTISDTFDLILPAGTHKVDVYAKVGSGTATFGGTRRNLSVKEV